MAMNTKNSPSNMRPQGKKLNIKTLSRTVKMLFGFYPVLAPITCVCILFSAVASAIPGLFIQKVIESIQKWQSTGDWASAKPEIVSKVLILISLYVLSIIAITIHTQLMAYMTQGFLKKMRCAMFGGMQNLPIRYFDTNKHGDIMSRYTNDIDTLRQLVSQSLPSLLQSASIALCVFTIMLYFSVWLTLLAVTGVLIISAVTKKVGGGSAKYFMRQQKAVGKTEGFVQEMMNGQKVVKVFCHEQKSTEEPTLMLICWGLLI